MPALYLAQIQNQPGVMTLLIQHGARLNDKFGPTQHTALHDAALGGRIECMRVLLLAGADPNSLNKFGRAPLNFASTPPLPLGSPANVLKLQNSCVGTGQVIDFGQTWEPFSGRTGAGEIKKIIRKCKAETKAINRLDDEQKEFLERLRFDGEERERHKALVTPSARLKIEVRSSQMMIDASQYEHEVGRRVAIHIGTNDSVSVALEPGDAAGNNIALDARETKTHAAETVELLSWYVREYRSCLLSRMPGTIWCAT